MAKPDYFKVLGVARDATDEDIKKRYKELARQYHPDRNPGDKDAEERFKEINSAREVLDDPDKRKAHLADLEARETQEEKQREQEQRKKERAPEGQAAGAFGASLRGESARASHSGASSRVGTNVPPFTQHAAGPSTSPSSSGSAFTSIPSAALATVPWAAMIIVIGIGMSLLGTIWAATSFAMESESPHYGEGLGFLLQISAATTIPAIAALWAAGALAAVSRQDPESYIGDLMERSSYRLTLACAGVITPLLFVAIHWGEDFQRWGGSASGPPLWWWLLGPVALCVSHIVYLSLDRIAISGKLTDAWVIPVAAVIAFLPCIPTVGLPPLHL